MNIAFVRRGTRGRPLHPRVRGRLFCEGGGLVFRPLDQGLFEDQVFVSDRRWPKRIRHYVSFFCSDGSGLEMVLRFSGRYSDVDAGGFCYVGIRKDRRIYDSVFVCIP